MDRLLNALRAAAEPTRLRLLVLCARSELTVTELCHILGQSQPRVSRHLKLLCEAGLLQRFREGTWALFRLASDGEGGALARMLVDRLPAEDRNLALDLARLDGIKRQRAEAAAAYFRRNAAQWDRIRALHVDEAEVERALLRLLPEGEVGTLLDVGTGTGRMLHLVADRIEQAVGIDTSREMLAVARANLERAGLDRCVVRQADMYQLPWPDASFDAAIIHMVLHFAAAPADAIAEAARVLRPGGRLLVVDFAPHGLVELRRDHAHRRLGFAEEEIAEWCRAASLDPLPAVHLAGEPLTVSIWPALRPARAGAAAA